MAVHAVLYGTVPTTALGKTSEMKEAVQSACLQVEYLLLSSFQFPHFGLQ